MKKPAYFPVLDSMRFVACMCVFVAHSISFFDVPAAGAYLNDGLIKAGYYGVLFFYTLSGFLITYLLLKEKKRSGTIAVGRFYKRRALRIWPLYYLIIILSFFVFPHFLPTESDRIVMDWRLALLFFLVFLPNMGMLTDFYMATNFQTYTVGFEEQFYLIWPLVVRRVGERPWLFLGICFVAPPVLELFHVFINSRALLPPGKPALIIRGALTIINIFNIPAFVAGAAGAYWYLEAGEKQLRVVGRRIWTWLSIALLAGMMWRGKPWMVGYVNLLSALYVFLILNLIVREDGASRRSLISSGGKISYGIYIFHPAVLLFVFTYVIKGRRLPAEHPLIGYFIYLLLSLALVLGIAALSYKYFEQWFLRKKERLSPLAGPAISLVKEDPKL